MQLAKLHRYIGIFSALFIIYFAATGLFLNHSHDLALDKQSVQHEKVLGWYNIDRPNDMIAYPVDQHWITQWQEYLYFDSKAIARTHYNLIGAIATNTFIVIAMQEQIWLVTIDGELVEKITSPSEKLGDLKHIGIHQDHIVLETATDRYMADKDLISWQSFHDGHVNWSAQQTLPAEVGSAIFAQTHSITRERLLLDLHSGRFFGTPGVIFVDLIAIMLIVLAITGTIIWYRRSRRFKQTRT